MPRTGLREAKGGWQGGGTPSQPNRNHCIGVKLATMNVPQRGQTYDDIARHQHVRNAIGTDQQQLARGRILTAACHLKQLSAEPSTQGRA